MDKQWDSQALAEHLLALIPKLRRVMSHHVNSLSKNETTLMQIGALYMLTESKMTTSDLAKKRHVSLQAASTFVQGLVEKGWVVRVPDPNDRRSSILEVTPAGIEQESAMRNQMAGRIATLIADLSPEETSAAQIFLSGIDRIMHEDILKETLNETNC